MMNLERSAVPRYLQLATLFRRRIETGLWKVGQQIPTVDELVAECGVARATVRQALGVLEKSDLIERFRAKGTFVTRQPNEQLWCEVETNFAGLLRSRPGAVIELLSAVPDQQPLSFPHEIGVAAPAYRHFRRRHWRNNQPFLISNVYVDERLWPLISDESLSTKTTLNLVADLPGVTIVEARQSLTIGAADMETANQLELSLNAPVAHVHRSAVDRDGYLIVTTEGIYRGDVVRLDIKLR